MADSSHVPPPQADTAKTRADRDDILLVNGVIKSFGGVRAVDGATFAVRRASVTALIGPNGAGKTSLFNIIAGYQKPEAGEIRYDGHPITGISPHRIARLGLVRTFQLTRTFAFMSVLLNMMVAAPRQPGEHLASLLARPAAARRRERQVREQAREILTLLGLGGKADAEAGTLSGGERKLLELGRSLMLEPQMVLLDEPMAGVNRTLGRQLLEHIEELRTAHGTTFLFIEHDMDVVMGHADHVVVMSQGRVLTEGAAADVRTNPVVIDAYLGSRGE